MTARASLAQAKMLAWTFSHRSLQYSRDPHFNNPTIKAIIRNGWVSPNGRTDTWPSGALYDEYEINASGMKALALFLAGAAVKAGS